MFQVGSVFGVAAAALLCVMALPAAGQLPTPEIRSIEEVSGPAGRVYLLRGELGGSGSGFYVGFAAICVAAGSLELTVHLSGFPPDYRPVQLVVRAPDGRTHRFGPVVRGGPEHGFHSPQLVDPADQLRFLEVALRSGALVSNGYNSFWNRVGSARNRQVRDVLVRCVRARR